MSGDKADCGHLSKLLSQVGIYLDQYLDFDHPDAMINAAQWRTALGQKLPQQGIGIDQLLKELGSDVIPNGSQVPNPGCTAFINTGATSAGVLATLAANVAAPQRYGLTAFNFLEELSLQWMAEMFELPVEMKGVYSSGGSVANLVALGAARQSAFEKLDLDPAADGLCKPCVIYATHASHHTIHRAAAVLGIGRNSVVTIPSDELGRMIPTELDEQLDKDSGSDRIAVAVVANAGVTSTVAIDPLSEIGEVAKRHAIWFHIDGAYGLPGVLDPAVHHLYDGLALADSVTIDPHKWLGAPIGIGATFVRDRSVLNRAFTQEASDYLEGSMSDDSSKSSMDDFGIPYHDLGIELSAPSRGMVVWALIREIGREGLRDRICRHNAMARWVAKTAREHPSLEVVQEPTLSICCFRYVTQALEDLNDLNRRIHREMVHNGLSIPSTAMVNNVLAIRPCFLGARTTWRHAEELISQVIETGNRLGVKTKGHSQNK
jgi:glutamate/tyrosine decarboxylase-like PLP-dependent enzyme